MPKRAKELGALEVSRLKDPGFYAVGTVPGLHLQVSESGSRSWILRATIAGKRSDMGLGGYPSVTLAGAFEKAREARATIDMGKNPIQDRRAARSALQAAAGRSITFEQAAATYIESQKAGWRNAKHAQQWTRTMETYVYPTIGKMLVGDVALPHVLAILEPLWRTKTETASRVRNRIELILDWAAARGYRSGENPARWRGLFDKLLPRPTRVSKRRHHRALPARAMGAFMVKLRALQGTAPRALEFTILTAARSGEVIGARWCEIDLEHACWTIPEERMKAGKEHRVPLSPQALALLDALPQGEPDDFVFKGRRGRSLSNMCMLQVMRRLEAPAVPHGFRSTFRDWASESTSYPRDVCEQALAHAIPDKSEAAYRRGDMFMKRRRLMKDWAVFISMPGARGKVVPIRAGEAA